MTKFLCVGPVKHENDPEPNVPDKAILAVYFGVPHLLYYQGTGLDYWVDGVGRDEAAKDMYDAEGFSCLNSTNPYGISVWIGRVEGGFFRACDGDEYDSWLEGECRPILEEEWKAFVADEFVWDFDACDARRKWEERQCVRYDAEAKLRKQGNKMKEIIEVLGEAPDSQLDASLATECKKFASADHTDNEYVRFVRDLRDKCVFCAGASQSVMLIFNTLLAGTPESEEDMKARRKELEDKV